ncbi:aspartate--tRNA(Asn) ligase [Streptosporangium amethystogenes subsp. fukuiense]|uniref:Aspartate--tRNA(Asp/Asn) ligase n=1 Tax=Streptosporangium amethystogenes subsp. fukuiense TaxID=698418 RepID=A0ABW2SYD6_9ACTN
MRILSSQVSKHVGEEVCLAGWLHRVRALKSVTFAVLRDRDGLVQVVAADPELVRRLAELPEETVVEVVGTATANPQAPGGVEITSPTFRELSDPAVAPPFDLYRPVVSASLPTVLDNAAVALRHPRLRAPFEISAASVEGFRRAMERLDFIGAHTPKVVSSATESGANVFALDWFGRRAYLAQSPQFYKQTLVGVFERVYEIGPVFRAEPHDTARHLAQYTSLDAEMGFVTDHRDVMAVVREAVADMVSSVAQRAAGAVELIGAELPDVPAEIPSIHFADAQELLARESGEDPRGEPDLAPAHERWLCEWAVREYGSELLFVTGYPMAKRPFYTHPDPLRPEYSNSFDLLFRGLELVTGGQRLHRHSDYLAALRARGESPEPYAGYLAAFAHGMPPHGGFALGLERFVARLTGMDNVRWTTLFPRDLHRLTP